MKLENLIFDPLGFGNTIEYVDPEAPAAGAVRFYRMN
jgi:hypothetical protein